MGFARQIRHIMIMLLVLTGVVAVPATTATLAQDSPPPSIHVREDPVLGRYLSDAEGMTLYLFTNDTTENESTCYDQCAEAWPPFTAEEPVLPRSLEDDELTSFERTDGTTQLAYNGIPLYYWASDEQPGDTTGQGVGDVWYVVAPGMTFADMASAATPAASPAPSPAATDDSTEVEATVGDFFVASSRTTFTVGETYTFTVTNEGEMPHEFEVELAGAMGEPIEVDGEEAEIEEIAPGATETLTVTFSEPGNYQLACHLGQHYQNGMALNIVVEG
jgi:predicted lipoprotein with Yx(FWY)xxD motif/uncharacterized cupredoxin-like copper-binding protein